MGVGIDLRRYGSFRRSQAVCLTVYSVDKATGRSERKFDQEAHDFWAAKFTAAGLDPKDAQIVTTGNKKDMDFWMMGGPGPCGPCSEVADGDSDAR